jgi:glucokinase
MPSEPAAVVVDAGGTSLKGGVVFRDGRDLAGSRGSVPVDSEGSREAILEAFAAAVSRGAAAAAACGAVVAGIAVAVPGPFDFPGGKSLMTHKLAAIRGVELRPELVRRCGLPADLPIRFLHDVHAFLRGEVFRGAARGFARVAGVTLGTGLGFGCFLEGRFLDNGSGSPHLGLYKTPCGASILEDFVSRRGIRGCYRRKSGDGTDPDVAEIAARARSRQDRYAMETFHETGRILADHLAEILRENRIECLLLGGQISKAFDLFQEDLEPLRGKVPTLRTVRRAEEIDKAPLYGAADAVFSA